MGRLLVSAEGLRRYLVVIDFAYNCSRVADIDAENLLAKRQQAHTCRPRILAVNLRGLKFSVTNLKGVIKGNAKLVRIN